VQASYPPATYARLVAVKDRYDPANLFQLKPKHPPLQTQLINTRYRAATAVRCPLP
jgi:hypothetical protein